MLKGAFAGILYGSIEPDTVEVTVRRLRNTWFAVAGWQAAMQTIVMLNTGAFTADLLDAAICAIGGYFLGTRKSRSVAISLFAYSLASAALTFADKFGAAPGGTNIILAVVVVAIGWRGIRATWVHHSSNGLRTAWKRVIAISSLAALVSIVVIVGLSLGIAFTSLGHDNDSLVGSLAVGALLGSILIVMAPLTWWYPFARPDPRAAHTTAVAKVFD
jgi:hypothetical protein